MSRIRRYRSADADELIEVWLASTITGQAFLTEEHWRAMEPEIRELLPVAESWVVEDEGRIVAFVSLLDDLIGGLFSHPDHQGRGHGTALVARAATLHDPLFVEVFAANQRALGFYRCLGFVDHDSHSDEASGLEMLVLRRDTADQ